jgi:elongation factor G
MAAKTPPIDLSKIRNIGIIAHIDAGKTTTTDHILYYAGAKHRLGAVDKGTTTTDYDEEEQNRGITIYSACIPFRWRDCTVNLIDTPGHVDFTAEVERALRVLDGCVVVFDARNGVEAQSETVWRQADKYGVPRLVFINKMDVVGADFPNCLEEIRDRLEGRPVALTIPVGSGSVKDSDRPFAAVIDLLTMQALYYDPRDDGKSFRAAPIPADMQVEARAWRERLFDQITQHGDSPLALQVMDALLEGREVPADQVRQLIRELTLQRAIQPVFCGSGREHVGIQPLMDAVAYYLPSPLDRPPVKGVNPNKKDREEKRQPDPKEPFCGLVFKIVADPHGELFYVRVYSGTVKANSRVLNAGKGVKEFMTKLFHVHADPSNKEPLDAAVAGDIIAVIGPKDSVTGDTLCDPQHPILLERITFADAVVSRSIEPHSSADKQKLIDTLNLLKKEDPTFDWRVDPDTGQTLMTGMGLLHLEVKQHRMERDFRLRVRVGKPLVSFRETLRRPVRVEGVCDKHAGTASLFAKLTVEFEPFRGEPPVAVENRIPPEALPPLLLHAAEQGIRGALLSGELGFPVMNVKATMVAAEVDQQFSNDIAFQAAGADAVHKALRDNIVLLEPVMRLEVTVPEEYFGPVSADLNARRANITEVHLRGKLHVIEAEVPLRHMFDYSDTIRSLSQGRASWTMEPHAYAPAPDEVLQAMLHPEEGY